MIRVLLADDHAGLREGVAALIGAQFDMRVEAQASTADEAVALCSSVRPDVAVIDLGMPGGGLTAIERITATCSGVKTIVFSMRDDEAYVRATIAAGGSGYVIKGAAGSQLVDAIRSVAAGEPYVSVRMVDSQRSVPRQPDAQGAASPLSVREWQVLDGLVRGFSNREIAERLDLSVKTVDTYRARLQNKLGAATRAELVTYALRTGLLSSDDGEHRDR